MPSKQREIRKARSGHINRKLRGLLALFFFFISGILPCNGAELVMFESSACVWCEAWDEEVGQIYPKTDEAKILPLRKVDIDDPLPPSLQWVKGVVFTPTFIVVEDNKEVGRIVGYSGEAFFWGFLSKLANQVSKNPQPR